MCMYVCSADSDFCCPSRSRAYSPRLEAGQPIPGYLYIVQKAP